jgi:hypothetical protein
LVAESTSYITCAALFSGNVTVTNCILWNNTAAIDWFPPDTQSVSISDFATVSSVTYSDIQRSQDAYPGAGNINADPLFVDPANGDFQLRPGSPCINAGSNAAILATGVATDLDGNPRIASGTVDLGAYELPDPATLIQALRGQVQALVASGVTLPADGQSLYAKLDAARAALQAGNPAGAIASLQDFKSQVAAFVRTGKLTPAQGQALIDAANVILARL